MTPGVSLKFPSSDVITAYLVKHPLTNTLDQKIIIAVADFFANSSKHPLGIPTAVTLRLYDLKISLPVNELTAITFNLTEALKACALGKEIIVEKKSEEKSSSNPPIFPSETVISSFLKKYSFIDDGYLEEKGVNEALSKYFAGKPSSSLEIKNGVNTVLDKMKTKLDVPDFVRCTIFKNLQDQLQELANSL